MQIVLVFFSRNKQRLGLPERGACRRRSVGGRRSQRPTISLRLQLRLRSFSLSLSLTLSFSGCVLTQPWGPQLACSRKTNLDRVLMIYWILILIFFIYYSDWILILILIYSQNRFEVFGCAVLCLDHWVSASTP